MMKVFFKWIRYAVLAIVAVTAILFLLAYWNRDAILQKINKQLTKGIQGELHIGQISFTIFHSLPDFSISLHNVYLRDSLHHHNIFSAQKVFLDLRLYDLFRKEINVRALTLKDAEISLFRSKTGYINSDIFKSSPDSSRVKEDSYLLTLPKFELDNVRFVYADSIRDKMLRFQFLKTTHYLVTQDGIHTMQINGPIHFDELTFNADAGGFLMNKKAMTNLHIELNPRAETLTIQPSSLKIEKSTVNILGEFDLKKDGNYRLNFEAEKLDLAEGQLWLNKKINTKINPFIMDKPVDLIISLTGKTTPGFEPAVDVQFKSDDCSFSYGKMDLSGLTFSGSFTYHPDTTHSLKAESSKVTITSFSGNIEKVPFRGNVTFTHLHDPVMDLSMISEINFKELNNLVDTNQFVTKAGTFITEIKYRGKLNEYLDYTRTKYEGILNGKVKATNASFYYKPKKISLQKVNAIFEFNEKQFTLNNFSLLFNGSPLQIKGSMRNFIPFFIRPKDKGYVKLNISSPHFDLTSLSVKKTEQKKSDQELMEQRKKVTDLFDLVYQKLEFDLHVNATEFIFRKFNAQNISGQVKLAKHSLEGKAITMIVAAGRMDLSFLLSDMNKPTSELDVKTKVNDANIKDFFQYFNNFNQQTVQAHNLSGTISAQVKFNAQIKDDYSVVAPSMKGNIDCKIKEGVLKDFEPLQNLSTFLFRKRDFTNVQFAELNSKFEIDGTALNISRMEIQSTVLTMFLHGRYSFTDSTSLSLQLPLSNLKKRDKNYKPENIGVDTKAGPSVFLHLYRNKDVNSKINIAYDPFKKWAKR